jgi:hypothetical protein
MVVPNTRDWLPFIHPRSLKHLSNTLNQLVEGKLWLKVLIALVFGAVPPAAAFGATRIESMRPKPTRNGAIAGATTAAALAFGTTTVVPAAPTE